MFVNDIIWRQDAIELAMQYCPDDDGTCSKADEDIRNLLDELEALPSAQPQYDEAWRKKHYETSYSQGYVDGYKMCEARMKGGDPHE